MKKIFILFLCSLFLVACMNNNAELTLNVPNPSADDVSQKKEDVIIKSTPSEAEHKIMENAIPYKDSIIINGLSISIKDVIETRIVYPSKHIDNDFNRYLANEDEIYTKMDLIIKNTNNDTVIINDLLSVYLYNQEFDYLYKGFFILDTFGTILPLENTTLNPNESISISALIKTKEDTIKSFSKDNFTFYIFGDKQACYKKR